jgi:hypothetical protein
MGKLTDLSVQNLPLDPGTADVFHLAVFYPGHELPADPTCSFTTGFTAHQEGFFSGEAYFDSETRRSHVTIIPKQASSGGDVIIENEGSTVIENTTSAESSTGGNSAGGSVGGDGAPGGSIRNDDGTQSVRNSSTGNGGSGGAASTGGTAISGDASARASSHTTVNTTETVVTGCGCTQCGCAGDVGGGSENTEAAVDTDTDMIDLEQSPEALQASSRDGQRREQSLRRADRSPSVSVHDAQATPEAAEASGDVSEELPSESAETEEDSSETTGDGGDNGES